VAKNRLFSLPGQWHRKIWWGSGNILTSGFHNYGGNVASFAIVPSFFGQRGARAARFAQAGGFDPLHLWASMLNSLHGQRERGPIQTENSDMGGRCRPIRPATERTFA